MTLVGARNALRSSLHSCASIGAYYFILLPKPVNSRSVNINGVYDSGVRKPGPCAESRARIGASVELVTDLSNIFYPEMNKCRVGTAPSPILKVTGYLSYMDRRRQTQRKPTVSMYAMKSGAHTGFETERCAISHLMYCMALLVTWRTASKCR